MARNSSTAAMSCRCREAALAFALLLGFALPSHAADAVKIGGVKVASGAPAFIAVEKGYFAAENIAPELIFFDASQPIAVAVVSGAIDFGISGTTGGLFSLAGQGVLKIIAGQDHEAPGFQGQAYLASNHAFAQGLTSFKDVPGHAFAITQYGSTTHYALGLLADKYGFDLKSVRLIPLTSIQNMISAVTGGQVDFMIATATAAMVPVRRGDAHLMGWVGDETPWQIGIVSTSTKTADGKRDLVERFLRAYRRGTRDCHEAFADAAGKRADGPTADAIRAIISKYTGESGDQLKATVSYVDADARLDVKDVLHQIAWYRAQNLLKGEVDGEKVIDARYVVPLP
jgi:NitT/TauT family transport system substrate-binding protein